jgi:hypothetical protein
LPIRRLCLVSPTNDPWLVGGHSLLVRIGGNIESCHHPDTIPSRLTRRCSTAASRLEGYS